MVILLVMLAIPPNIIAYCPPSAVVVDASAMGPAGAVVSRLKPVMAVKSLIAPFSLVINPLIGWASSRPAQQPLGEEYNGYGSSTRGKGETSPWLVDSAIWCF
jgi:hypothetical protein